MPIAGGCVRLLSAFVSAILTRGDSLPKVVDQVMAAFPRSNPETCQSVSHPTKDTGAPKRELS